MILQSSSDIEILESLKLAQAREQFWAFRRVMRPEMIWGWWVEEVALELQRFYDDFRAGRRPRLALMAPPQHGKSSAVTDFIAWAAGKNPDCKTIFASYSADLGVRTNLALQRMLASPTYRQVFGLTRIGEPGWQCNNELIEFVGHPGSFRNTTIDGPVTGMELNLGVIDDPVKGRAEASSKVVRDRTWNWFTDDFCSRFAANSALLIIMTRWHLDDLVGRLIERFEDMRVLPYPALAEKHERHRREGEPLFPQLKPLDFLLEQRKTLREASWEAMYQQRPIIVGGGMFPIDKLAVVEYLDRSQMVKSVRYVDKAGTSGGGAHTAMVLMHKMRNGTFAIEHVVRGQWAALEREQRLKFWAEHDRKITKPGAYEIVVEQEPGSGGKESAEATIRNLAGFRVVADRVTGSKEVRADPFAAQVQGGNVKLVAGAWHRDFLDELESFPNGRFRDQVDAASGAFNRLALGPTYSLWSGAFD
jgi:predicted phage terminase large subunit-like protein